MTTVALAVTALSLMALAGQPAPVRFPGESIETVAPTGLFSIRWLPPDEPPLADQHRLLLKNLGSGAETPLLRFDRWVEVLWSPDGTRAAITDGVGSDGTETSVYSVEGLPPVAVWPALERQVGKDRLAFVAGAHHMYVEASTWMDDTTLAVRVWGYGGEAPFDKRLQLRLPRSGVPRPNGAAAPTPRTAGAHVSSGATTHPRLLSHPRVEIPREMEGTECTSGHALVEILVGADGLVSRTRLLKQSGASLFDVACVRNAHLWTFEPAKENGRRIETSAVVTCSLECR